MDVAKAKLTDTQRQHLLDRIQKMGGEQGLTTPQAISRAAGLGEDLVGDLKTTLTGPSLAALLAICTAVGAYSIDELLGDSATTTFYQRGDSGSGLTQVSA
jgi:hypothetical protein